MKTTVKVEFVFEEEHLNLEEISSVLNMKPTEAWKIGDEIKGKSIARKQTSWAIGTGYEESIDINDQLMKVISLLKDKVSQINEISLSQNTKPFFLVVIKIYEDKQPLISILLPVIQFANSISAEILIDWYIF